MILGGRKRGFSLVLIISVGTDSFAFAFVRGESGVFSGFRFFLVLNL